MMSPRRLQRLEIKPPMSPIEHGTLTSRPMRKALGVLCILLVLWLVFVTRWETVDLGSSTYQSYTRLRISEGSAPQWVGGGAVVPSPNGDQENRDQDGGDSKGGKSLLRPIPDVIRISFEEAVQDIKLDGWEDEWFSSANFDAGREGPLPEPKIDFVYNWVNGTEDAFKSIRHSFEVQSPLNDAAGNWIAQHSINRYRDWDELKYSMRSLDTYAKGFINKIQILVNSVSSNSKYHPDGTDMYPQRPTWLKNDTPTNNFVQILPHESFFEEAGKQCLPTFNSLSIESQIHMTPSTTDRLVAMSDDMFLGMPHAPSDFYSPLFGSVMGFKPDSYNVKKLGSQPTFGEKPFAYYTSYLLNHRFGQRARKVQAHFGHSVSRAVMKETMSSFPQPSNKGTCERFRGESHFQIYPWYASFHYTIERFREALLWSFIMSRSDANSDGYLDWKERQNILETLEPGWRQLSTKDSSKPATQAANRERMFYKVPEILQKAGLQPPKVNMNILWTSLDGPETIRNSKCHDFNVDKCFADSFGSPVSDATSPNPDFSASNVFSRLSSQHPECGDCLIKFLLASTPRGLEPLLPPKSTKQHDRQVIIKALKKYQHTVVDTDAMKFVMVKDAEQAQMELLDRTIRQGKTYGQWCLNDDVMTESAEQVGRVQDVMKTVFKTLWPEKGRWEKDN
ncbi:hypothetical protein JX265_010604 [Neoarthrinium moseri]|uniref:Stealth protein CR2 conserved region 2 domain-containing protein n=1 Tax=Neoarthrinium moseri TaxID=1658444 RepID=A0A9P9WE89_9PEZI|nr:hypothetical protein JX266_007752 [Neoarthrinium moseri]KAI1859127.1 hypothetical protein JX265_010604 [Neoarthrinium moseri]